MWKCFTRSLTIISELVDSSVIFQQDNVEMHIENIVKQHFQ